MESTGGVLVFWDNKAVQIVGMEARVFSISCMYRSYEDGFVWIFTRVYVPI